MTEDQLREQMRRVDDLTPPAAPDFAARAMGASDRRTERRRTWSKAVLGVAAAIAIGTLSVTALSHSSISGGSTASGVAAPEAASAGDATGPAPGLTPQRDGVSTAPGPKTLYTGAECAGTLATVHTAIPALQQEGFPIISAACDPQGVVVVRVGTRLTPDQRHVLTARYGTHVSVADRDGTPLP